jgi:hypothetical protein
MHFATRKLRSSVVNVVAAFAPLLGCSEEHQPESNPPNMPPGCEAPGCPGVETNPPEVIQTNPPEVIETSPPELDAGAPRSLTDGGDAGGPPPCPTVAPTEGSTCAGHTAEACQYGDCDGGAAGAAVAYECDGSRWQVTQRCANTTCPSTRPIAGSACDFVGALCEYSRCGPVFNVTARCQSGAWNVNEFSCNPPPPPLCPEPTPVQGADCNHATGSTCYVALSSGAIIPADCVNGRWQVHTPDAGS